jgi:hypothetical protein
MAHRRETPMSTTQRNDACTITVSPDTADVLREEFKKVLEFNHDHFEDLRDFGPDAQHALARMFTDTITIINTVGWDPKASSSEPVDITLTAQLIEQLHRRRYDLGATNIDRLDDIDTGDTIDPGLLAEITTDRLTAQTLDHLIADATRTTST